MVETQIPQPEQWWAALPAPRAHCPEITADEVMKMFDDMDISPGPRGFLLIDVRRTDWEVRQGLLLLPGYFQGHPSSGTLSKRLILTPTGWNDQDFS